MQNGGGNSCYVGVVDHWMFLQEMREPVPLTTSLLLETTERACDAHLCRRVHELDPAVLHRHQADAHALQQFHVHLVAGDKVGGMETGPEETDRVNSTPATYFRNKLQASPFCIGWLFQGNL